MLKRAFVLKPTNLILISTSKQKCIKNISSLLLKVYLHFMKVTNIILTLVFALFAFFQLNDIDPWAWVIMYGVVAVVSAAAIFRKYNKYVLLAGMAACVIWTGMLLPEFINWVQMGMPNIAGQMKAEAPHVEYTREFLGLILAFGVFFFHYRNRRK